MNHHMKHHWGGLTACVGASLLTASSAFGQLGQEESFFSRNGALAFHEVEFGTDVSYSVDVLAPISIHAVAFSFYEDVEEEPLIDENPFGNPFGDGPLGGSAAFGTTSFGPWNSMVLTPDSWNSSGEQIEINGNFIQTDSLGTFERLFGESDNLVMVYYDDSGDFPLNEDSDVDQARWGLDTPSFTRAFGSASTEGLFFDGAGAIAGSTTIPEPSIAILAGLSVLGFLNRRR